MAKKETEKKIVKKAGEIKPNYNLELAEEFAQFCAKKLNCETGRQKVNRKEILDIVNSNRQRDFPIICDILEPILNNSGEKGMLYLEKAREAQDAGNTILMLLYFSIFWMYVGIIGIILSIGASFGCDWAQST